MSVLKFSKMQGLGNDFIVIDRLSQPFFEPDADFARHFSDRHFGIGFDQMLLVEPPDAGGADFRYRIFNADGGEVEQCGNGARCFLRFVREKGLTDKEVVRAQTMKGEIELTFADNGDPRVDMGRPVFDSERIPFLPDRKDELTKISHLALIGTTSLPFTCVSMGNPHAVVAVDDLGGIPIESWAEALSKDPRFPQGVNVGFMQILSKDKIRLRVRERGSGFTLACGTGACAAVAVAATLGLTGETVEVEQKGGACLIDWTGRDRVTLTGPAQFVFDGQIDLDAYEAGKQSARKSGGEGN